MKIQRQRDAFAYRIAGSGRYDVQLNIKDGSHPPGSIGKFDIGNDARSAAHKWADENGLTLDAPGAGPDSMGRSPEVWTARRNGEWVGNVQILHDDLAGAGNPGGPRPDMYSYAAKQAMGDCYETAGRYMLENGISGKNPNIKLVHGEVSGQGPLQGKTFGHAWIEDGDNIIDNSNGRHITMPKSEYYHIGNISNTRSYSPDQASKKFLKYEHFGPWDDFTPTGPNYVDSDSVKKKKKATYELNPKSWFNDLSTAPMRAITEPDDSTNPTWNPDDLDDPDDDAQWQDSANAAQQKEDAAQMHFLKRLRKNPTSDPRIEVLHDLAGAGEDLVVNTIRAMREMDSRLSKAAAVTQDLVDNLDEQFHDWYADQAAQNPTGMPDYDPVQGPIGNWANIESFMSHKYPEAYRGLRSGLEEAAPLLDGGQPPDFVQEWKASHPEYQPSSEPYASGNKAMKAYGYDPAEIAAGMLLLHNHSHPFRGDMAADDQKRLNDIAKKRHKMQRNYEQRTKAVAKVAGIDWSDVNLKDLTDQQKQELEELMKMQSAGMFEPIKPSGKWYHVSPHDMPEGTALVPGGITGTPTSQSFYDMGFGDDTGTLKDMGKSRTQHVWLTPDLEDAHFWSSVLKAPHIYEVEPGDEPQAWNGTGVDGYVSGGAKILRKLSGDPVKEAAIAIKEAQAVLAGWNDIVDHLIAPGGKLHGPWSRLNDWAGRMEPKFDSAERVWSHGQDKAWDNGAGDSAVMGNVPMIETIRNNDVHDDGPKYDPYKSEDTDDSADWRSNADAITNQNDHFQLRKFQDEPGVPKPLGIALDSLRPSVALQALPGIPAMEEEHYQRRHNEDGDPDTEEGKSLNDGVFLGLTDLETVL